MARLPRAAGLLAVLALAVAAGSAAAQVPTVPAVPAVDANEDLIRVGLTLEPASLEVPRLGQERFRLLVEDRSAQEGKEGILHTVHLDLRVNQTASPGWVAFLGSSFFQMRSGEVRESFVVVQAPPTIQSQFFHATVTARMTSSAGGTTEDRLDIVARVAPFALFNVDIRNIPPLVGPFTDVTIPVLVSNVGVYPDTYTVTAAAPDGWFVATQPRLTLFPGEEREVRLHVLTPADRVMTPMETGVITVQVQSTVDPGFTYERATIVTVEGLHVPGYWVPLMALGAVLTGAVARKVGEDGRRRAKEQGRPMPARLTPAQEVMLAHLKKTDPERYRAIVGRQRQVLRAREGVFLSVRGRREQLERALVERQHAQAREAKLQERLRQREQAERLRELERRREAMAREKARLEKLDAQRRAREEAARLRDQRRLERQQAPMQRRLEREKRARERQLRAQLERRKRALAAAERKRRVELERRTRMLERRKKELERKAQRAARKKGKGGA